MFQVKLLGKPSFLQYQRQFDKKLIESRIFSFYSTTLGLELKIETVTIFDFKLELQSQLKNKITDLKAILFH